MFFTQLYLYQSILLIIKQLNNNVTKCKMNAISFTHILNDKSVLFGRIVEDYVCELMQQVKFAYGENRDAFTTFCPYDLLDEAKFEMLSSSDQHNEYEWNIYEGNILIKIIVVEKYRPIDPFKYCQEGEVWKEGEVSIQFELFYKSGANYYKCNTDTIHQYNVSFDEMRVFNIIETHICFICEDLHAQIEAINTQYANNMNLLCEQDAKDTEEYQKWKEEEERWEAKLDKAICKGYA